jgi:hypothetical protein
MEAMSSVKKEVPINLAELPDDPWERWKAIQLTEEQSAELRRLTQIEIDRARASGVYERLLALRGKVKFSLTYEEMADKVPDRDDRD